MEPGVAIILVNWNGYKDTFECLKSLEQIDYKNYKVFVVDNGSTDGSYDRLLEDQNHGEFNLSLSLIPTGANLGFAGGNNVGIEQAQQEGFPYFWLLNNDTTVESNTLSTLIEEIMKNPAIGIVGSKIYYAGTDLLWFAGGAVNAWTGSVSHIGLKEKDKGQYDQVREVDYITGCSLLFRKELLDSIGKMREDYFLYYEETDWNLRASKEGWKIVYVPSSVVHHKVSVSSGGEENPAPFMAYYEIRNSYVLVRRMKGKQGIPSGILYTLIKTAKKIAKIYLRSQDRRNSRFVYIIRGFHDAIQMKMGKHPGIE